MTRVPLPSAEAGWYTRSIRPTHTMRAVAAGASRKAMRPIDCVSADHASTEAPVITSKSPTRGRRKNSDVQSTGFWLRPKTTMLVTVRHSWVNMRGTLWPDSVAVNATMHEIPRQKNRNGTLTAVHMVTSPPPIARCIECDTVTMKLVATSAWAR
eukprot:3933850-Rhodomonas_salina.1